MKYRMIFKKCMAFILTAVLLAGFIELFIPRRAFAANFLYLTDIRLASGENAFEELEDAGYNVMAVGLSAKSSVGRCGTRDGCRKRPSSR